MTQEFINAVVQYTTGSLQNRQEAESYLVQLETQPQAFNIGMSIIQGNYSHPNQPQITQTILYFALKLIESSTKNVQNFNGITRKQLSISLLDWCLTQPAGMAMKKAIHTSISLMIGNNQFLPSEWPITIINLKNKVTTELQSLVIILTLKEINDELIEKSKAFSQLTDLSNKVKDAFRENGVKEIVDFLYRCMTNEHLVKDSLELFGTLVSWIDISFSTNSEFVQRLYSYLNSPALFNPTIFIFSEIISKGMDPMVKLSLIHSLQLIKFIPIPNNSNEDSFTSVCKLSGVIINEILAATERKFPVKALVTGRVQIQPEVFNTIQEMLSSNFIFFVNLFQRSSLDMAKEFSSGITKAINDFFAPLLNKFIIPNSLVEVESILLQALYSKYQMFIKNEFDDDGNNGSDLLNCLKTIYRASSDLDQSCLVLQQFLQQLMTFNLKNPSVESVSCHAYFILHFPDKLMARPETVQFMTQHVTTFSQQFIRFVDIASEHSPIYPAISRFLKYISGDCLYGIIEYSIGVVEKGKCFSEIKDLVREARSNGMNPRQEWSIKVGQIVKNVAETIWIKRNVIETVDLYSILSDLTDSGLSVVIKEVFGPEIEHCNSLGNNGDIQFTTQYIGSRLKNVSAFLKKNGFTSRRESFTLYNEYCPIVERIIRGEIQCDKMNIKKYVVDFVQMWIEAINPEFHVIPSIQAMSNYLNESVNDILLLGTLMTHLLSKQNKLNVVILGNEFKFVLQGFLNSLDGTDQLNETSELFREKMDIAKVIFSLMTFPPQMYHVFNEFDYTIFIKNIMFIIEKLRSDELAKMIEKYCMKSIEIYLMTNGEIGKSIGINIWLQLFTQIINRVKLTKNYGMSFCIVEGFKSLVGLIQKYPVLIEMIKSFISTLPSDKQQWVSIFYSTLIQCQNVTVPQVMNLLKGFI
ncbi:hypothetical protein ENUP19_0253G0042 [Entamoeba nuttalli]|uniref:Exportin-T n=2 Tax=Entamoeba nuttalli TaxID=412467 RepID=K2GUB1_ENTNP|nr:exportin T, putative [Entamoeba nuttalli P19]EKE37447.1 exportin T, putative [Entamoeba nuttalli P19]|eukprot:XP_008860223.1 exportin T, putative [Entamoeba nuttalli P19]